MSLSCDLSPEQSAWLDEHLRVCAECKTALEEYEQLVDSITPELPAEDRDIQQDSSNWSIEDAERRLFAALPASSSPAAPATGAIRHPSVRVTTIRYGIAATLLFCFLASGYGLWHRTHQTLVSESSAAPIQPSSPAPSPSLTRVQERQKRQHAEDVDREAASLREQVRSLSSDIAKLHDERNQQDQRLTAQIHALEDSSRIQEELKERLTKAESEKQSLTVQLASLESDRSTAIADASSLRAQLKEVNGNLQSRENDIAQDRELLKHDRDIRNLITARDLYIAEIYDVAKTGSTEKPFGRIFYTKGKSLIFYGYDLDQQPGLRNASTFQAWGRRGADDQHDVSLGILFQDDASQKRWVLKFNDSLTLAKIDEVFVTVEPKGGSAKPSGKPLLFASLRIDPNHP